ncbi:MAG: sigma-70 family RNA polymerase sigma factor [Steroidobacteraceae bacterium]|nr:sigma-70 family RNA polymerase sigma factor [Steroidobacteraceae bacterium]
MGAHSDRLPLERELAAASRPGGGPSARGRGAPHDAAASVEQALHRSYPGLASLLARRIGDRQLAQDLLHDAIVTTLDKLADGAPLPPDVLAGFVFRTALNHLRNHRRHERLVGADGEAAEALAADPSTGPVEQSQRDGMRELVRRVVEGLSSSRDRELLVRYYLHEEDKLQLCESMALSASQFDRVICRARERLRALLARSGFQHWDLVVVALLLLHGASGAA